MSSVIARFITDFCQHSMKDMWVVELWTHLNSIRWPQNCLVCAIHKFKTDCCLMFVNHLLLLATDESALLVLDFESN